MITNTTYTRTPYHIYIYIYYIKINHMSIINNNSLHIYLRVVVDGGRLFFRVSRTVRTHSVYTLSVMYKTAINKITYISLLGTAAV